MKRLTRTASASALTALLVITGTPAVMAETTSPSNDRVSAPTAPTTDHAAPGMYKRYLLANTYEGSWYEDGAKGIVKNFSQKRIIVRDTINDQKVDIWPGQAVVFYGDQTLSKFGDVVEGHGLWLEIAPYDNPSDHSEFRLSDPTFGRPDTVFMGPQRRVVNERESWREGDSHHELTPTHQYWIKRESDSWREKYDTWNSSDWAAFSIHVDRI